MSDVWQFRRGTTDGLQGRAIFIATCSDLGTDIALRVTGDIEEYASHIRIPKESLEAKILEAAKHWPRNFKPLPIFSFFTEPDNKELRGDLIYVGAYKNAGSAMSALQSSATLYMLNYNEQQLAPKSPAPRDVADFIDEKYLQPLIKRLEYGEYHTIDFILKDLFEHTLEKVGLEDAALELSVEARRVPPNMPLVTAYCRKVYALAKEDYESAARIRDEIARLR